MSLTRPPEQLPTRSSASLSWSSPQVPPPPLGLPNSRPLIFTPNPAMYDAVNIIHNGTSTSLRHLQESTSKLLGGPFEYKSGQLNP
eukprot:15365195-Ditylum_brightwellii.AAC.1